MLHALMKTLTNGDFLEKSLNPFVPTIISFPGPEVFQEVGDDETVALLKAGLPSTVPTIHSL